MYRCPVSQPPAADHAPRSVGFLLSQVGFATSKGFVEALKPLGLHPREYLVLRFIAAADGQSQQAVADRLRVPPSRMVGLVDRLEDQGLVERRPHPADRRVRALHMTERGHRTLAQAIAVAADSEGRLCSRLEPHEHEQLIALLRKLQPDLIDPGEA
jgi:DNA-binding MarR family transcriptional regulator